MKNDDIKENRYFEYRNVDHSMYSEFTLPIWIKNELASNSLKILDYGCGFGQNLSALKKEGFEFCYGVDIENSAIDFCHKNNLHVKKLDLDKLKNPFDFKFDVIILTHVIEHMKKDEIIQNLTFIKKFFLNEHGKLLIAVPNAQSNTGAYWMYEDWTHTTLFTSGSLYYVLKASGFGNVDFLDIDCTLDIKSSFKILAKKIFLAIYTINRKFWNRITSSYYHAPSPQIFSYEIKCKAY